MDVLVTMTTAAKCATKIDVSTVAILMPKMESARLAAKNSIVSKKLLVKKMPKDGLLLVSNLPVTKDVIQMTKSVIICVTVSTIAVGTQNLRVLKIVSAMLTVAWRRARLAAKETRNARNSVNASMSVTQKTLTVDILALAQKALFVNATKNKPSAPWTASVTSIVNAEMIVKKIMPKIQMLWPNANCTATSLWVTAQPNAWLQKKRTVSNAFRSVTRLILTSVRLVLSIAI
jgi:hypothetical protein